MSIKIMTRIWETGPHDQGELLTLLALADWANDDGRCWPSMRAIAEKVRVTERSAQRIVRRLEVSGWVEIETGGGRHGCNSYTINPDARVTVFDEETTTPASPRHKDGGDTGDIKPRHRRHKTPTPASPEPLRTTTEPSITFDDWYSAYPRKVGKGAARTAYAKAVKKADPETIFSKTRTFAKAVEGKEERFTPYPATWLNQERWDDEQATHKPEPQKRIAEVGDFDPFSAVAKRIRAGEAFDASYLRGWKRDELLRRELVTEDDLRRYA